ncbi:MAG TPA: NAD(P)/FAD-dependent oxidoreductase, partial [Gemmatimonadales bacterium]|nr:NAD(P)/FAD-dependent oxidoreductase [Gemmatimonadales bacterium]
TCSEYMSPETVRLLDRLGVMPALERAGGMSLRGTAVTAAFGSRLAGQFDRARPRPFRATGLALPRRTLDSVLLDCARAAGVEVREGTAAEELLRRRGAVEGVRVRTGGGWDAIHSRLVVGADGLRSVVARRLAPVRHEPLRRFAFVAHATGVAGMSNQTEMHVSSCGYAGLNPLGGGVTNVALVLPAPLAHQARGRRESFFREQLERFPKIAGRLEAMAFAAPLRVTGPFAAHARRVIGDGVLLVGDAAEFFDPFTGEGIGTALRGAELAAAVITGALRHDGPVTARSLIRYRQLRRRAFTGKWVVERMVSYAMQWPALFDHAVERLGRRAGMADTFIGVTGGFVPAGAVLNPGFLARMVF